MSAGVAPSVFLRRIADRVADPAIAQLARQAADAFDAQHNHQNNAFQIALSNAELSLQDQIGALKQELLDQLSGVEARQHTMLELLETLQLALQGDEATS